MSTTPDPILAMLASAKRTADHFEGRDAWALTTDKHRASFEEFMRTGHADTDPDGEFWSGWTPVVRDAVARGVQVRRLRLVSEPVTDYIRWEHALTPANIAAGEQVRWLPRRLCMDLAIVPVDYWVVDAAAVRFSLFSGDGVSVGREVRTDADTATFVADAFASAWERGIPHDQYNPA